MAIVSIMAKVNADEVDTVELEAFSDREDSVMEDKPKRRGFIGCLINNWFMLSTIIGVVIGFGAGFGIQKVGLDEVGKTWLGR